MNDLSAVDFNTPRDYASLKLGKAIAILDVLAMTHCNGDVESLNKLTESTLLMFAEELLHEAKEFVDNLPIGPANAS